MEEKEDDDDNTTNLLSTDPVSGMAQGCFECILLWTPSTNPGYKVLLIGRSVGWL